MWNERHWNALLVAGFLPFEHCTGCHLHVQLRKQKVSQTIMTYTDTHNTHFPVQCYLLFNWLQVEIVENKLLDCMCRQQSQTVRLR